TRSPRPSGSGRTRSGTLRTEAAWGGGKGAQKGAGSACTWLGVAVEVEPWGGGAARSQSADLW
ncbi:hypothetical protein BaRGS_00027648, partial [Batillaria attramentaria]